MAGRSWGGSIATAVGVGGGLGAAQLGVGYGLGIVSWPAETGGAGEGAWVASLAWATWIAATSATVGAICADRLSLGTAATVDRREHLVRQVLATSLWRVALALAAAIGALVTVPLVAVPARTVEHATSSSPETIAGGYAVVGIVLGLLVALGALGSRAVAANVIASATWLWLLAIVAVVDNVAAGRGLASAQLAVWQFTSSGPRVGDVRIWQAVLTLGTALVIGVLAALPAARRDDGVLGVAVSGAVGPLLVAAAYFLSAPTSAEISVPELSAYLVVPYAVIAGLAGSATIATLGARYHRRRAEAPWTDEATETDSDSPGGFDPWTAEPAEATAEPGESGGERG